MPNSNSRNRRKITTEHITYVNIRLMDVNGDYSHRIIKVMRLKSNQSRNILVLGWG